MKQDRFNKDARWDFKLEPKLLNGEFMELLSFDMLCNSANTYEVKSENKYKWGATGNIFVEFAQMKNGKWVDSGIAITESDFWMVVLKDYDNRNVISTITLETTYLKKRIVELMKNDKLKIDGKPHTEDGTATKGYLIPIQHLFLYEGEHEQHRNKRVKQILNNKNYGTTTK